MTKLVKNKVPVTVGIPFDLLHEVDELLEGQGFQGLSRSEYVVNALREQVRKDKVQN